MRIGSRSDVHRGDCPRRFPQVTRIYASCVLQIVAALVLVGCATSPPIPPMSVTSGDRIGFLVTGTDSPTHTHVGTTIFNNFARTYEYDWNLREEVAAVLARTISEAGFSPVDLEAAGVGYADVEGLVQVSEGTWVVPEGKEDALHRLRTELALKAVIVLNESRVLTAMECGAWGCSEHHADASGLFTRSMFGMTRYSAVAAYRWNVFLLDPVADVAATDALQSMLRIPAAQLANFQHPAEFKNLTEDEFAPVREAILAFVQAVSSTALKSFSSASGDA